MPKTELFVGNLDRDVQRKEIEDVFEKRSHFLSRYYKLCVQVEFVYLLC